MQITTRYGLNTVTREVPDGATVADLLRDPNIKAGLGFSDNVKALVNGVELPMNAQLQASSTVVVEARCNSKAQDAQQVTVRFGLNSVTRAMPYGVTVGQVRQDPNIKASLGYSDNVKLLLNAVELPDSAVVPNGATLVVETRCNAKAN